MKTSANDSMTVIQELQDQINLDEVFKAALLVSLQAAKTLAQSGLSPNLYQALDQLYASNGWPTQAEDYLTYLTLFAQIIPAENSDPSYGPWQNTSSENGYSQEVYDRLCHFYWLVDQAIDGVSLQDYVSIKNGFKFAQWLDEYATAWGSFLNTKDSLTLVTLASFIKDPAYNMPDYMSDEGNWTSFNTFFFRQLNATRPDGSPMRPVANPDDNTVICSPADCTFKAVYQIDSSGAVIDEDGNQARVTLKKTHSIGNISDLLGDMGSTYASTFYGGTFVHYFLSPFDYHRFHTPVSGIVLDLEAVPGYVYLDVQITEGQFDAPDSAEDGYEFTQARGVLVIDTADSSVGKVAVIPIGMAQVSSVHMYTDDLLGKQVLKGTEFGYFAFGGSDIIMLFEKPVGALKFITQVANAQDASSYTTPAPFHFKYGEPSVFVMNPS